VAVAGRGSAASSLPWLDNIASSIYRVLCPLFTTLRSGRLARRNIPTECHPPNSFKVEFVPRHEIRKCQLTYIQPADNRRRDCDSSRSFKSEFFPLKHHEGSA
jgi:hypothetical protein